MTWAALLSLSALSSSLAYMVYFAILARAGAANLMPVTLLIPPFAIGLGALFLGERMSAETWTGFAIIALGFAVTDGRLYSFLGRRAPAREKTSKPWRPSGADGPQCPPPAPSFSTYFRSQ